MPVPNHDKAQIVCIILGMYYTKIGVEQDKKQDWNGESREVKVPGIEIISMG